MLSIPKPWSRRQEVKDLSNGTGMTSNLLMWEFTSCLPAVEGDAGGLAQPINCGRRRRPAIVAGRQLSYNPNVPGFPPMNPTF